METAFQMSTSSTAEHVARTQRWDLGVGRVEQASWSYVLSLEYITGMTITLIESRLNAPY